MELSPLSYGCTTGAPVDADSRTTVVTRVVTDLHEADPDGAELLRVFQSLNAAARADLLAVACGLSARSESPGAASYGGASIARKTFDAGTVG